MLPPDQLRLIACLTSAIPLSYALSCFSSSKTIILFSIIASILMQIYVFGEECIFLWVQQHTVYLICKYSTRSNVGMVVCAQSFCMLLLLQCRRMYLAYGEDNLDITAIFMMQTFLYIGFAYNYEDGKEGINKNERTIVKFPDYFEYLGYVLFIPSCLVGPVFQFNDYYNYIHRTGVYSQVKHGFSIPAIIKQFKTFLPCILVFSILCPFRLSYLLTQQYAQLNFLFQIIYLLVSIIGTRFKYYTAWSLGMVAFNATGITYNPQNHQNGSLQNNWYKVVVSNIATFELDPSMKKKADAWNIPIQLSLKKYVYDRLYKPTPDHTDKQKKKLQIMAQQKTLAVSAVWHGLYPGYFFSFFHWALLLQISQQFYRMERQSETFRKWREKLHYVELVIVNYFLGYFGVCFMVMRLENILTFFKASFFIPVVIAYVGNILIVRLGIWSKKKDKDK